MKPETKLKLKKVGSITWTVLKFGALIVGGIIMSKYESHIPNERVKTKEELEREEAERIRRNEEHQQFLNSLTENERRMYNELRENRAATSDLQDQLASVQQENEQLKSRIRELEPEA